MLNIKILTPLLAALLTVLSLRAQDSNGEIVLDAKDAMLSRGVVRYDAAQNFIRDWRNAETVAAWRFNVPAKTLFNVHLTYSCIPANAGTEAVVTVADQRVTHLIANSGDWNTVKQHNIGPIILRKPGTHELRVQLPQKKGLHGAWQLRSIRLVPEKLP